MEPDLTIQEYFAGLSKANFSLPKSGLTDMTHIDMIPSAEPQKSSIKADMNRVILDRSSSSQGSVCWSKMM